jgi:hypothetical protein
MTTSVGKYREREDEQAFYNLRPVQQILNFLVKETIELKPVFDQQYMCRYPEIEQTTGLHPNEVPDILDKLAMYKMIDAHFYERIPICDKCTSANILIKFVCTHCKSSSITKHRAVEHVPCGYLDIEDKFRNENNVICPRCNTVLHSIVAPYVKISKGWFFCGECSKRSQEPLVRFSCRECDNMMSISDVSFTNVYSYALNENADLSSIIMLEPITKTLENLGYHAEAPGSIIGKSGISHTFDIVCRQLENNKSLIINLARSNVIVSEEHVIRLFASAVDVNADNSIIIAIPAVTEAAERLANQYGITIVQASDTTSVSEKLQKMILSKSRQAQPQKVEYGNNNNLNSPIVGSPLHSKLANY